MPRKNGKTCLQEIRNDTRFNTTPVVMFSTSSHHKDIQETYDNGANRYIRKDEFFGNEVHMLKKLFSANWKQSLLGVLKDEFVLNSATSHEN
jgi:DNA-binding NarL/FixJ family response regulator